MTRGDDGSATVWLLLLALLLAAAAGVAVASGEAALARHRAAAAADAAALAGAGAGVATSGQACGAARAAAAANQARLVRCQRVTADVTVAVVADPPAWLRWLGTACAVARAGPIRADPNEPPEGGRRRNLDPSTSLCPVTKQRE